MAKSKFEVGDVVQDKFKTILMVINIYSAGCRLMYVCINKKSEKINWYSYDLKLICSRAKVCGLWFS